MSTLSRDHLYRPPRRYLEQSEFQNVFFASDVMIMNSREVTAYPGEVDFLFATSVSRNPSKVQNTIPTFPWPGVKTSSYGFKDYRFSKLPRDKFFNINAGVVPPQTRH